MLAIEAMKMETAVTANKDGVIAEIVTTIGEPVNAKDLLVIFRE